MRKAVVERKTKETQVRVELDLDGSGRYEIATGIGFLDHMLELFARHGQFDLVVNCRGDLHIDAHHSVEDVGIVMGQSLDQALGDKMGISRFAHAYVPLDEALARVVVDLSGRPYLSYRVRFRGSRVGDLPAELIEDFWMAFANNAKLNMHIELITGRNLHHIFECIFKAAARALAQAVRLDPRVAGIPSTKGVL